MTREVSESFNQVRKLYEKVFGTPAPDLEPRAYAPFPPGVDPLSYAQREVEFLERLSERLSSAPRQVQWVPQADCLGDERHLELRVEVPGVERGDLEVFVADGECVVRGERKPPEGLTQLRPLALERPWGPFERRFPLPSGCNPDRITARCADGLLELRLEVDRGAIHEQKTVEVA